MQQKRSTTYRMPVVAAMVAAALAPAWAAAGDAAPSFTRDIKGILSNRCVRCHGPDPEGRAGGGDEGLRLDTFAGATADLGGHAAIVPGKPDASELIARITSTDPDLVMPPPEAGERLPEKQVELLKRWIAAGATYEPHWAYVPPKRPPVPAVKHASWPRNDIDRFILARLEAEGLAPQPEADRATLARRLALDLTGLPPTPAEVDAFVADTSTDAVEQLVDRLLAHDGYGEHMARQWLDLARYADSAGYADDPPRTIWGWRDWVVRAFDANMPFDEFTIRQLAGDLLPNAALDDKVATAFHRNTLTNNEGGTIDEEYRTVAVIDRVNTTMSTWMGTTMACAQCHDHKYDPLSQKEYFQVYAILNNTADADRKDESPVVQLPWKQVDDKRAPIEKEIAEIEAGIPELKKPAPTDRREPPEFQPARKIVADLRKQLDENPAVTVPVLEELAGDKRRITKIQLRGNWQNLGDEVREGVPDVFHDLTAANDGRVDRMALAKWLVDPANPLTARVVVNRIWERLFGIGIVSTSEEFGSQGDLPSHPELLDWLACELVESGWNLKALQRLIVTSAAFGGSTDWQTSTGEDRYRRALYTTWRRSNPYPAMATFDAPSREVCTIRRPRTNTPLQALVTMNDPAYVEAAQALARRMVREGGSTDADRAAFGFRLVLARRPAAGEIDRLVGLHADAKADFAQAPDDAAKMATDPLGPVPNDFPADMADLAAWTVVANVILNLDETFMCP